MGQSRPLFHLFSSFSHSNINYSSNSTLQIEQSVDGVLGVRTRARRIEGRQRRNQGIIFAIKFYIIGLRRAPPVVGRVINISHDLQKLASEDLLKTFFISPIGSVCFVGKFFKLQFFLIKWTSPIGFHLFNNNLTEKL